MPFFHWQQTQTFSPEKIMGRLQIPAKPSPVSGHRAEKYRDSQNCSLGSSPRPQHHMNMHTPSLRSTLARESRREAAPVDKYRERKADKVVVRRALTPPTRRLGLRWWNFRPKPSRLSNMSVA